MEGIEQLIKQVEEGRDKAIDEERERARILIDKLQILRKYSSGVGSREEVEELMNVTCFGNLAYCCGLEKQCFWRDTVRTILGISDEDFCSKEKWIWEVVKI